MDNEMLMQVVIHKTNELLKEIVNQKRGRGIWLEDFISLNESLIYIMVRIRSNVRVCNINDNYFMINSK
jgi:hypothetical protein